MRALLLDLDDTLLDHRAAADAAIAAWCSTLVPTERHPGDLAARWTALEAHHVGRADRGRAHQRLARTAPAARCRPGSTSSSATCPRCCRSCPDR